MLDCKGKENVSALIEQSKLPRFIIYRGGATKATPVFSYTEGTQPRQAQLAFESWANTMLAGNPTNSNVYDIMLFDEIDETTGDEDAVYNDQDETPQSRYKKTRGKKRSRTLRFTFCLAGIDAPTRELPTINGTEQPSGYLTRNEADELVKTALERQRQDYEKRELLERLEELEQRLDEADAEADEVSGEGSDWLGKVERLAALANLKASGKPSQAVNGAEAAQMKAEQLADVNKAIKILMKHDDQLGADLLKLANIAESNPKNFSFLLNALRNM